MPTRPQRIVFEDGGTIGFNKVIILLPKKVLLITLVKLILKNLTLLILYL
jgi:hypothetical protein